MRIKRRSMIEAAGGGLLESIYLEIIKLRKEVNTMAATLAELKAEVENIKVAVDADVAQTALVVEAVNALIAKIEAGADFTEEVEALRAATAKLSSDNAVVQAAINKANTPVP